MDLSPTQKIFLDYWSGWLERADGMPARRDLDVRAVGKYLPHAVIFDILDDPRDFRYRLVGTEVRAHTYGDYTGKKLSEMDGKGPDSKIWSFLDKVRTSRKPLFQEVPYVGPQQAFLRSTLLFLPLADDHRTPDKILLVSNFISKVA